MNAVFDRFVVRCDSYIRFLLGPNHLGISLQHPRISINPQCSVFWAPELRTFLHSEGTQGMELPLRVTPSQPKQSRT